MRPKKYNKKQVEAAFIELKGWTLKNNSLRKKMTFRDFSQAFGFMTSVALEAQRLNHHPDWKNVYNRLSIELSTHDAGGLTELDFKLAKTIDKLLENGF